ncbi:MAG: hypothetical protein KAZ88_14240 [Acidimicrobiia bacterium]|nr:hypothetical protein [Acidimicrobiia bacterium]MBP8182130.1 hypothetical protein [Acidimicrobiia bacterium]
MVAVAFLLGFLLSVAIGLVVVGRERQRFSRDRPPVLYDEAVAYIWVVQTIDQRAAATLTEDDAQFLVNSIGGALSNPTLVAESVPLSVESEPVAPGPRAESRRRSGAQTTDSFLSDFGLVDYLGGLVGPRGEPYSEFEVFSVVEAVERYLAAIGATGLVRPDEAAEQDPPVFSS